VEHQYIQLQEVVGILFDQQVPIMKKQLVHEFLMTILRNYEPKFNKMAMYDDVFDIRKMD
jgi:hypothetical protein